MTHVHNDYQEQLINTVVRMAGFETLGHLGFDPNIGLYRLHTILGNKGSTEIRFESTRVFSYYNVFNLQDGRRNYSYHTRVTEIAYADPDLSTKLVTMVKEARI